MNDDSLREHAVRLCRRYQVEVVEAFRLCPWAERARLDGHTREVVVTDADPGIGHVLSAIDALEPRLETEIGFVILPRLSTGRREFERFVSRVVTRDRERRGDASAPFAMAAFHPDAEPDLGDAERLVPFIRRTPDPTIQLVRIESLERVRRGPGEGTQLVDIRQLMFDPSTATPTPTLRERIAQANLETILSSGVDAVTATLEAILEDRKRTYRALASGDDPCRSS